jgi:Holliday junction resolvase RusA-like endonuclease
METTEMKLWVPGEPRGKQRAGRGNGHSYTPRQTELAEALVVQAWRSIGEPRFPVPHPKAHLPVKVDVLMLVERRASHYNGSGELNTEGLRHPLPENRKPDVDNAAKLIMDALNKRAYKDDVQVTDARFRKRWSNVEGFEIVLTVDEDDASYDR